MNKYPGLFEPWSLGNVSVPNRIALAPMGALMGTEDGFASERAVAFYEERAAGGAGLIVLENTCVEWPRGKANTALMRADLSKAITGLRSISERVQYYGSAMAAQLQHAGGQTTLERTENNHPYAASPIAIKGDLVPIEMTKSDIQYVIQCFANAANVVKRAGFNCVEIHGAHGYLVSQFLSPLLNRRRDEYGGEIQNRVRFAVELVNEIQSTVGKGFPIIFRMNASDRIQGGTTIEDAQYIARALEEAGISALSISTGLNGLSRDWVFPPSVYPQGCNAELSHAIKKVVSVPVGVAGRIDSPEFAEEIIRKGQADFIVLGRPLVAEPQWGKKVFFGKSDRIRPCLYCNKGCTKHHHNNWRLSCDINIEAGRELEWQIKPRPNRSLRIAIVGGGPAGMEAARRARLRGHSVQLFEKEDNLGGQLVVASCAAHKTRMANYLEYLKQEMKRLEVNVECSIDVSLDHISKLDIDGLVVATGSTCKSPSDINIQGVNLARDAWDVLKNGIGNAQKVVILGGGHVGVDLALHLTAQENPPSVSILEMRPEILTEDEPGTKMAYTKLLAERGIEVFTAIGPVLSISENNVTIGGLKGDTNWELPADLVVLAIGSISNLPGELSAKHIACPVVSVGDCIRPRGLWEATHEGAYAILQLERFSDI